MLEGYHELENQRTPFELIGLEPEQEYEIKNNIAMRGFPVEHTAPAFGYVVFERRTKLKEEYVGFPQEKLRELKDQGVEITRKLQAPLVAYLGDTEPGAALVRQDVRTAQVVISECTFFEEEHRGRAKIGKHLHVHDIVEWLGVLECETLVLIHVSRRTNLALARKRLAELAGPEQAARVEFLMDFRTNRARYEKQVAEAERAAAAT
jgi:ribonuclease Z